MVLKRKDDPPPPALSGRRSGGGRPHIRDLSPDELKSFLATRDIPTYRATQIHHWLHKKHVMKFSEMKNLSKAFQEELSQHARASVLTLVETPESKNHEALKYLTRTEDGFLLESVLIQQRGRLTVCVSTQLGCKIGCTFCASGKGAFGRNLSAGEIVEQVSIISRAQKKPVTNVVFMGMGEPLDNYDATLKALEILMAGWGLELGGRRITVSTSGLVPQMEQFVNDSRGRVRLSVSLHSSLDAVRSELVPINKRYPLDDLMMSLERMKKVLKRDITFEYTLIKGVNDSETEARGVRRFASRLNAKVNLIPYNPISEMDYERPSAADVGRFQKQLEAKNVRVIVRQTAGRDIDAACGQLRLNRM